MLGLVINLEISILGDWLHSFINKYLLNTYCGPLLLDSVVETQVSCMWMIRSQYNRNTISENTNHFSVGTRKCFMEVLFELNLEEQVEVHARWDSGTQGGGKHIQGRRKRVNNASHFTPSKTDPCVSPHIPYSFTSPYL